MIEADLLLPDFVLFGQQATIAAKTRFTIFSGERFAGSFLRML
ncbi:MAG: hypothetical protein NUV63_14635 [Gallionella sp.]|nr:hypothetical protein [Gallionella sp.]